MSATYYVALPFVHDEDGIAPAQAQECHSETAAIRRAEAMAHTPPNVGALAFKRSGDPNLGQFGDAMVIRRFGDVPERLDEL
jgi:hypothetical protein